MFCIMQEEILVSMCSKEAEQVSAGVDLFPPYLQDVKWYSRMLPNVC